MNKKMTAVLAATCVLGATTAFAVNPFSDVTPDDWAYQAVEQLAYEGVIEGYPDGTFGGQRNITRYEMAQMVARAMAREDQLNAEQQAQINRLAAEFANELNSLGVRVTNLENRIGNVRVGGDARMRYADETESNFDMRARLQFNAKVAENTKAVARITTGNFGFDSDKDADLELDRLYVAHNFDGFTVTGGRYGEALGETGYWYDDAIDGAKLSYKNGEFEAAIGYGTFQAMKLSGAGYELEENLNQAETDLNEANEYLAAANNNLTAAQNELQEAQDSGDADAIAAAQAKVDSATLEVNDATAIQEQYQDRYDALDSFFENFMRQNELREIPDAKKVEATYGKLGYSGDIFNLSGTYIAPNGNNVKYAQLDDIWGVGTSIKFADKFKLSGDFFQAQGKNYRPDADFWVARLDYGELDLKKPGTFNLFVDYVDAEKGSYFGGTGSMRSTALLDDVKAWGVGGGVVVAKNVKLEVTHVFDAEDQDGFDKDDRTVVQAVYKF